MRNATIDSEPLCEASPSQPANFNRLASIYRWAEWLTFGPILSQCRRAFLPEIRNRKSALVIGDGDGRFIAQLLEENSCIIVEAVDASEAMLLELTGRAKSNARRLKTRHADARTFIPASLCYDLAATHFFLDCLSTDEVANLAARLHGGMMEGALWVISDFAVPKTLYGRLVARPLVASLYQVFGMLTGLRIRQLPDHPMALAKAGFRLMHRRERLRGLLVSELWRAEDCSRAFTNDSHLAARS